MAVGMAVGMDVANGLFGFVLLQRSRRSGWNPLLNFWTYYIQGGFDRETLFEVRLTPSDRGRPSGFAPLSLDRFVSKRSDNLQEKEASRGLTFLQTRAQRRITIVNRICKIRDKSDSMYDCELGGLTLRTMRISK